MLMVVFGGRNACGRRMVCMRCPNNQLPAQDLGNGDQPKKREPSAPPYRPRAVSLVTIQLSRSRIIKIG